MILLPWLIFIDEFRALVSSVHGPFGFDLLAVVLLATSLVLLPRRRSLAIEGLLFCYGQRSLLNCSQSNSSIN